MTNGFLVIAEWKSLESQAFLIKMKIFHLLKKTTIQKNHSLKKVPEFENKATIFLFLKF